MIELDIQRAIDHPALPSDQDFQHWVHAALDNIREDAQLTIRLVDHKEGSQLNEQWRHKSGPTNVLSFPAEGVEQIAPDLLGDIVICQPVVETEAQAQKKPADNHWAHLVIHGVLHLIGYDHIKDNEAEAMETLEIEIMNRLGLPDPYHPPQ